LIRIYRTIADIPVLLLFSFLRLPSFACLASTMLRKQSQINHRPTKARQHCPVWFDLSHFKNLAKGKLLRD
jgi:hypothetical protein